jgi:hypothetical protein
MDGFALFGVAPRPPRRAGPRRATPRGRRAAGAAAPLLSPAPADAAAMLPSGAPGSISAPQPRWVHNRLVIGGPADRLAAFQQAASGAGVIPWHYDYDRMEEDWFHLMVAPPPPLRRTVSLEGARIIARQLRDLVWAEHEAAISQVGVATGCPFDLFQLVPIPFDLLRLGPDDPAAIAWMAQHWGTTWALRHVRRTGDGCEFFSADQTPAPAMDRVRAAWPELTFTLSVADGATRASG